VYCILHCILYQNFIRVKNGHSDFYFRWTDIYTVCFKTLGHNCRRWFPRSLWSKKVHINMCPILDGYGVSNLILPLSSPPTTRRVTVEVFDPASYTQGTLIALTRCSTTSPLYSRHGSHRKYFSITACFLFAGETFPQSCFLVTALVLSPVYTIVTWQWVYRSQYYSDENVVHQTTKRESATMIFSSAYLHITTIRKAYAISFLSMCLCVLLDQHLNAWENLYETWYAYHATWAHTNGVLHKSLPSASLSLYLRVCC
jgi:hypothetical protein